VSTTSNGTLVFNADGTYTYTPAADFNGTDSFTYRAVDALGAVSNTATVTISVNSVNAPPITSNTDHTLAQAATLIRPTVLANNSHAHAGPPALSLPHALPIFVSTTSNGTLVFNADGTYTYTPAADFNGTDSFTYRAVDALGAVSNIATVTISV